MQRTMHLLADLAPAELADDDDDPRLGPVPPPRTRRTARLQRRDATITAAALATGGPSEFMSNSQGRVHGGLVGTDHRRHRAPSRCASSDPSIATSSTVSMHIDYLRPLVIGADYVCTGEVLRIGGRLAVADARIVDAEGQLSVRGSATFAITRVSLMSGQSSAVEFTHTSHHDG